MKLFEDFQTYAGRRIQRLFSRSPRICSFYGLGWIRLERFIEVKKLLFVRSVLSLGLDEPSRRVFCSRLEDYLVNVDVGVANVYGSNVFDMLNVASDFGVLDDVVSMARLGHIWSKDMWKKKIWKRAWDMDECFWAFQTLCHRSLDLLANVCGGAGYLVWWQISDVNHSLMKCCEVMVRLLSHASLLKTDDVRLKGSSIAARFCNMCDHAAMDDARHLILQCPDWQEERAEMMREISIIPDGSGQALLESQIYCMC